MLRVQKLACFSRVIYEEDGSNWPLYNVWDGDATKRVTCTITKFGIPRGPRLHRSINSEISKAIISHRNFFRKSLTLISDL